MPRATSPAARPADAVARAVRAALAEHAGDVLAFLPGMGEIRRAAGGARRLRRAGAAAAWRAAAGRAGSGAAPAEGRRVVLATSIAETSLTVPGVRIVVDGGWRRAPRLDAATGLTRLATLRISRAAADQRAGRAGREAPGVAIRLWTAALHRGLAAFDRPEILRGRAVRAGAGLRRLGRGAGRPAVCRRAAGRRAGGRRRRCWRSWARWTRTGGSPSRGRRWRGWGRIRGWPR